MENVVDVTEAVQADGVKRVPGVRAAKPKAKWELAARDRIRAALKRYHRSMSELLEREANEADTRLLVTDFLCDALGYDKYADLSTEYRVKGEYVDYGIRLEKDMTAFIEVKRIGTPLGQKHLRQAQSYAVNEGVSWIILTNGAVWQVYHLSGGLPIITDLALEVDLLGADAPAMTIELFAYLARESLKRGKLDELWQAKSATSPKSLASIVLSPPVLAAVRKELRRVTGYNIDTQEIAGLLADTCLVGCCTGK